MLSTEISRELMRRHHAKQSGGAGGGVDGSPRKKGLGGGGLSASPFKPPSQRPAQLKPVPKALSDDAKASAAAAKPVEKRDMFGRVLMTEPRARGVKRPLGGAAEAGGAESLAVRFKYHEGVTDAVRRPVKVRDLL